MKPLVSIITPYKNAAQFIYDFVSSIKSQTLTQWVCIMVDDGSIDNGPNTLWKLVRDDPRFRLIENTFDKSAPGPASARNCALSLVQTEYIAFCDIDDMWHPQKLEAQLQYHVDFNLDLSVTAYCEFEQGLVKPPVIIPPSKLTLSALLQRNSIPMLTAIVSTSIIKSNFQEVPHEDYLFWLKCFQNNASIKYGCLPQVLAFYRQHSNNISRHKAILFTWSFQVYKAAHYSILTSILLVIRWIVCHAINYLSRSKSPRLKKLTRLNDLLTTSPQEVKTHNTLRSGH